MLAAALGGGQPTFPQQLPGPVNPEKMLIL
jgi:hypothetical protein